MPIPPSSVISDNDSLMNNFLLYSPTTSLNMILSDSHDMVLHPILSHYAIANPDYDVFSKTELLNNGYTEPTPMDTSDDSGSDTLSSTGSDFSWLSTCNLLSSEAACEFFDITARMHIVVDDFVTSVDDYVASLGDNSYDITATDIAGNSFPPILLDIVNA